MNVITGGLEKANLQLAWERSILNIETKYLGTFLKGLKYVDNRIPDDGQSERLLLMQLILVRMLFPCPVFMFKKGALFCWN